MASDLVKIRWHDFFFLNHITILSSSPTSNTKVHQKFQERVLWHSRLVTTQGILTPCQCWFKSAALHFWSGFLLMCVGGARRMAQALGVPSPTWEPQRAFLAFRLQPCAALEAGRILDINRWKSFRSHSVFHSSLCNSTFQTDNSF